MNFQIHATLEKFGYPETLVAEFDNWMVVARLQQVTLGSLVLIAKSNVTSFASLPGAAYAELEIVTRRIEVALKAFRDFDRINYIMLMMVDPQVHFHVVPRYSGPKDFDGKLFVDAGWPGAPDFKGGPTLEGRQVKTLVAQMKSHFLPMG